METKELCAWLRGISSGICRPAGRAADLIEAQAREIERLTLDNKQQADECIRLGALLAKFQDDSRWTDGTYDPDAKTLY